MFWFTSRRPWHHRSFWLQLVQFFSWFLPSNIGNIETLSFWENRAELSWVQTIRVGQSGAGATFTRQLPPLHTSSADTETVWSFPTYAAPAPVWRNSNKLVLMDWFLSFSVNQLEGFQQLTAVSNEEKTNHYLYYKAIYIVFTWRLNAEKSNVKLSNYYRPKRLTHWPDLPCPWSSAQEANVASNFLCLLFTGSVLQTAGKDRPDR